MSKPIDLTESNFDQQVLQAVPVLVDFWAAWCAPCRAVGPSIERLAEKYTSNVRVAKLNIDEQPQPARQFEINSIPAVLLFQNGKIIESFVGVQSLETYTAALDGVLAASPV